MGSEAALPGARRTIGVVLNRELLVHTGKTVNMLTGPGMFRDHLWEMM